MNTPKKAFHSDGSEGNRPPTAGGQGSLDNSEWDCLTDALEKPVELPPAKENVRKTLGKKVKKKEKKRFRLISKPMQAKLLATIIPPALKFVRNTWSVDPLWMHPEAEARIDAGLPVIFVGWHGREFLAIKVLPAETTSLLASHSNDGEMIARVMERFGFASVIRGSSSRGSVSASRLMARDILEFGHSLYLTVDGPRGPRYEMKMGAVKLASLTHVPIVPVSASGKILLSQCLGTWDHFQLPFFGTPLGVEFGEPVWVPANISDEEAEKIRLDIQNRLRTMTQRLDEHFGHTYFP